MRGLRTAVFKRFQVGVRAGVRVVVWLNVITRSGDRVVTRAGDTVVIRG